MPVSFRLGAFYFLFFVTAGLMVAYVPPYRATRGLSASEIAWVLAAPQLARVLAPGAWGALADRTGALRAIVVFGCIANALCFALLPSMPGFVAMLALMGITSLAAAAALPLVEAITLSALAGEPGRYGPIRLWGSIGFMAAVMAGGGWLESHSVLFVPYAVLASALGTVVIAGLLPPARPRPQREVRALLGRTALAVLASGFCMAAAHGTLSPFSRCPCSASATAVRSSASSGCWGWPLKWRCSSFCRCSFAAICSRPCSWRAPRSASCASWPSAGWRIGFCSWLPRRFSMRRPSAPFTRQPLQRYSGFFLRTLKRVARPCSRAWLMAQAALSAR